MTQRYSLKRSEYWGREIDIYVPLSSINETLSPGEVKTIKEPAMLPNQIREVVIALPKGQAKKFRHDADIVFITAPVSEIPRLKKKYESLTTTQRKELEDVYISWNGPAMTKATKVEIMATKLGQKRRIRYLIDNWRERGNISGITTCS